MNCFARLTSNASACEPPRARAVRQCQVFDGNAVCLVHAKHRASRCAAIVIGVIDVSDDGLMAALSEECDVVFAFTRLISV